MLFELLIVVLVVLVASGWMQFNSGFEVGVASALAYLDREGIIEITPDDE